MVEKLKQTLNQRAVREAAQQVTYVEAINVNESERFLSILAGGLLTVIVLIRRSWSNLVFLLVAGYLIFRGVTGYCLFYRILGLRSISELEKRAIERGEQAQYQPTTVAESTNIQ